MRSADTLLGGVGPLPSRAEAMAARVLRAARRAGVSGAGLALVARGHALAMESRERILADDHDAAFLHPGRTMLILLTDLGEVDEAVLAAAAHVETERPELAADHERVAAELGGRVWELVEAVPHPLAADLAERLVTAPLAVQRLALAERLDQLRHAHLWPEMAERRAAHAATVEVYAPLAGMVDQGLTRRYTWWCRMFERRHLR